MRLDLAPHSLWKGRSPLTKHTVIQTMTDTWIHIEQCEKLKNSRVQSPDKKKDPMTSSAPIGMMKYQNVFTAIYFWSGELFNDIYTWQTSATHTLTHTHTPMTAAHTWWPSAEARQNSWACLKAPPKKQHSCSTHNRTNRHTHTQPGKIMTV